MTNDNAGRIPSLDGCRAVAILMVIYWHLNYSIHGGFPFRGFDFGDTGVYIFFVLSGFLITTMLKREREQRGEVSLKNFYIRRFWRIIPPLLFLLTGIAVLATFHLAQTTPWNLVSSLFFLKNYFPDDLFTLDHLWTLSVEEQFYLLWPLLYCYVSRKKVSRLLAGVIVAAPVIRVAMLLRLGETLNWHTEAVADGLAFGCLLAIYQKELRANRVYQWFSHSYATVLLPLGIIAGSSQKHYKLYEGVEKSLVFICVVLGIDILMQQYDSLPGKALNSAPMVWLGKLSYSLYLWNQPFLLVQRSDEPYGWFPMNVALALAFAVASYYLVEQPAMRFGRQIAARRLKEQEVVGMKVAVGEEAG